MGNTKNKYRYNGPFEKMYYSVREIAKLLKVSYKRLKRITPNCYKRLRNLYEVPIDKLSEIKSLYQKKYGQKSTS